MRVPLVVVAVLLLAGCGESGGGPGGGSPSPGTPSRYAPHSPERLLAIGATSDPSPSDDEIRPYARALDRLRPRCKDSRMRLADMATNAVRLAADENVKVSTLAVLRGVRRAIPDSFPRRRCADMFAAYLTVLTAP